MEEELDLDLGITVITIVIDDTKVAPLIDLDNCPPHVAIAVFSKAIEALEELLPYPTVTYQGKTVISDIYVTDEEETE